MERNERKQAYWRRLSASDIPSLARVADRIHPGLPEADEVFSERVKPFPEGCLALVEHQSEELCGYAISHPIKHSWPPALNSFLREISADADQYYIHDLAILPEFRGRGFAQECTNKLLVVAERYPTSCLTSVYGTAQFWGRFGFVPVQVDDVLRKKLLDYGDDAVYLQRENGQYQQ